MAAAIELLEAVHEAHDEEDVYGEDYLFTFQGGDISEPAGYSAALVIARVLPAHRCEKGQRRATLTGLWNFPPIRDGRERAEVELELAAPIDIDQLKAAASGLIDTLRSTLEADCDTIRARFEQTGQQGEVN